MRGAIPNDIQPTIFDGTPAHITRTRFLEKGSMLTMDHVATRLNVEYDKDGKITRIFCG